MQAILHHGLRRACGKVIGLLVLVLAVRTLVVTGLVTPVVVRGSSMTPTLQGEHWELACPRCRRTIGVGVDQRPPPPAPTCLACGAPLPPDAIRRRPADSLWIDRTGPSPRRWGVTVFRCPYDARTLCIKRIIGLPGETITIVQGDLFVDGERAVKDFPQQMTLRRLEHEASPANPRWSPWQGDWRRLGDGWRGAAFDSQPAELRYASPIYDDLPGNVAVSRRFNVQRDLMIEAVVNYHADACWQLLLPGGHATIDARRGLITLSNRTREVQRPLGEERVGRVLLSNFDRRLTLAADGRPLLQLPEEGALANVPPTLRVVNASVAFTSLRLYKDVYYEAVPLAPGAPGDQPWRLGPAEYFVLGDNQAVSVDSRTWGAGAGLPRRLILGEPLLAVPLQ